MLDNRTAWLMHGGQVDVDVIYTDVEQVFDKVPHLILLSELISYKIHNKAI
jgi:hypothetical protein